LILLGGFRFSLIDRGGWTFPDEYRYYNSYKALSNLGDNNLIGFFNEISITVGRPGDATLRLIPAAVQKFVFDRYGIHPTNPRSLLIPLSFNVIITLVLAYYFFRTALLLFKGNYFASTVSVVAYSFLVNSNLYIRHILPYDMSLLCFMIALFLTLKLSMNEEGFSIKSLIIIGGLTGFAFTVYPGYYFLVITIFSLVAFNSRSGFFSRRTIRNCFIFCVPAIIVLLAYEVVAIIGGESYLSTLSWMSSAITQGSFEEGFTFLPEYLIYIEKSIGVFLLVFTILYLLKSSVSVLKNRLFDTRDNLQLLVFVMFAGYLIHASSSAIFHGMVFYGRLLHIYFPVMVLASVSFLTEIKLSYLRRAFYAIAIFMSLYSFSAFFAEYRNLGYPRDVLYANRIASRGVNPLSKVEELEKCNIIGSPPALDLKTNVPYTDDYDFILVNFCHFFPVNKADGDYKPSANARLIFNGPHFQGFRAYQYEGLSIEDREIIQGRDLRISIYELL
jgi:hypothetical protein